MNTEVVLTVWDAAVDTLDLQAADRQVACETQQVDEGVQWDACTGVAVPLTASRFDHWEVVARSETLTAPVSADLPGFWFVLRGTSATLLQSRRHALHHPLHHAVTTTHGTLEARQTTTTA